MTLRVFAGLEQLSPEWYEARRGVLTASAVGRMLTPTLKVAGNETSRGLVTELAAERITGWVDPTFQSDDMLRGVIHEFYAREKYAAYYAAVDECGFMVREFDGTRLGYSPDGLVGDDGLIEIKCPRAKEHLRTIVAGEVPGQYMAQLQAGLLVSGRAWIDYVSFYGGLPLYVQRVEPIPEWRDAIRAAVVACEIAIGETVAKFRAAAVDLHDTERVEDEGVII